MKKIAIRIIDKENLSFELLEDAKKGDYVSFKEVAEYAKNVSDEIGKYIEQKIKERIEKEKINIFAEYLRTEEFKENYSNPIEKLKTEKIRIEEQLLNQKTIIQNAIDAERNKNIKEKNESIFELNDKNNKNTSYLKEKILNLEKNFLELISENKLSGVQKELEFEKKQTIKIAAERQRMEADFEIKKQVIQKEYEIEKQAIQKEHENEIKARNNRNIKQIGNELEKWCEKEYNDHFSIAYDDCLFEPTNKTIEGKKPDYIFKVFNQGTLITSVILEMKSESDNSDQKNKSKNIKFLDKLEKDRENHKAEYGLLVTELEWEDNFVIRKVNNQQFSNIYIVRPQYFLTFLSLVRSFVLKKKEILNQNIDFELKQKILNDFNDMKNDILDFSIKNLEKDSNVIIKHAIKIGEEALKIEELANKIINSHISRITNKIEKFNIKKILKKIDNTDNE